MTAHPKALRPQIAGMAVLGGLLAGCLGQSAPQGNLAHACQTRTCTCEALEAELFRKRETTEPRWRLNGDAYCPDGFALKRTAGR